jgi:arylsulfatase A-like enzyme
MAQKSGTGQRTAEKEIRKESGKGKQPNVVFFFVDQQRWDTCGCYGQRLNLTPNLDAMAAEGVLFERAFTCQPVCGPARACLQTGKWATEMGTFRNDKMLPQDEKTIAHHFNEWGYQTAYIGKWHLASEKELGIDNRTAPVPRHLRGGWKDYWLASDVLEFTSHSYDGHMFDSDGNERVFPEGRYRADAQTDWAIEYLKEKRDPDRPFFLFLSYIEPHHQNDHNCYEGPVGSKERFKDYTVPGDLEGTGGDWRENYPDYLGCINSLDANLGRIRATLKELKLAEDTLVVYSSDHGSHFCTRNSEYKRSCHDGCTRIPMVLSGPGFSGGKRVPGLVSLLDLPPTFLEAAGIPVPPSMGGDSLVDLGSGTAGADARAAGGTGANTAGVRVAGNPHPAEVFIQISESQVGRAIRTEKWKYSVYDPSKEGWKDMDSSNYVEQYLYDLEADPNERTNLVADPRFAQVRAELRERLIARMVQAHEERPTIRSAN